MNPKYSRVSPELCRCLFWWSQFSWFNTQPSHSPAIRHSLSPTHSNVVILPTVLHLHHKTCTLSLKRLIHLLWAFNPVETVQSPTQSHCDTLMTDTQHGGRDSRPSQSFNLTNSPVLWHLQLSATMQNLSDHVYSTPAISCKFTVFKYCQRFSSDFVYNTNHILFYTRDDYSQYNALAKGNFLVWTRLS